MAREVVWTERASSHLFEILAYVAEDSSEAARRMASSILAAAATLADFPARHRLSERFERSGIREFVVGRNVLLYSFDSSTVQVIALIGPGQELPSE